MQKPTGKPGELTDRIFRCLAIEHRIQDAANAVILGVSLGESRHSRDDGLSDSDDNLVAGGDGGGHGEGDPPLLMTFSLIMTNLKRPVTVRMKMKRLLQQMEM